MDKQKQIEEMADILCESKNHNCDGEDCKCLKQATDLYNAGYKKTPKNAIIISKEYYKRTIEIDVACEIAFRIVDIEQNARKEALEAFIEELKKQFDRTSAVFYPTDAIEKRIDKVAKDFGIKTTKRKNKKKHPNFKNHTSEPDWN